MSIQSFALLIVASGVLTACQTPPPAAGSPPPSAPPPQVAPVRPPEPPAPPPPASGPVTPEARAQAQKLASTAADLLQSGNEDQARSELKQALALDPQNKNALSLTRQMTSDPLALLGRESFVYTVRPGDTLAGLAQRFLGEAYLFYALARYNDIKVPRQLASGQVIRIPGKAQPQGSTPVVMPPPVPVTPPVAPPIPPATPVAALPPAPPPSAGEVAMRNAAAAERAGDLSRARDQYLAAERLGQPGAAAKAEQMRTQLITRWTLSARNAQIRQDLDGAIGDWQKVLDLDPDNSTARLGMARARDLKDKLGNVPK